MTTNRTSIPEDDGYRYWTTPRSFATTAEALSAYDHGREYRTLRDLCAVGMVDVQIMGTMITEYGRSPFGPFAVLYRETPPVSVTLHIGEPIECVDCGRESVEADYYVTTTDDETIVDIVGEHGGSAYVRADARTGAPMVVGMCDRCAAE